MQEKNTNNEGFRDSIATVDEQGKRVWVFPKKPKGKWFNRRKIFSYSLLFLLFAGPFLKINGEPVLLINIIQRKFVILGQIFWPEDVHLFAIGMIAFVILVIVFTVVFGRLFCGWACPQTIFMEMVFRRIEYWIEGDWTHQKKLDKQKWNVEKIRKRILKWVIFWLISFLIANTFLAYIIGTDELFEIITAPPSQHIGGLISLFIFTTVFFGVFTWFREQVCIAVCPYGRLQGVLLDKNSILVAYDYKRGENRAKFKKDEDRKAEGKGDCIDCGQCINVCPTGIDIRNGTQLECINCTACMDACDDIMEGVGLEKGLIRYDSEHSIQTKQAFKLSTRAKAYIVLMFVIMLILGILIFTRKDVDTRIMRVKNTSYQKISDEVYSNIYIVKMTNKTNKDIPIQIKPITEGVEIELIGNDIILKKGEKIKREILVKMNKKDIDGTKTPIIIGIYKDGNLSTKKELLNKITVNFSGPGF